jgi:hypothetical protein
MSDEVNIDGEKYRPISPPGQHCWTSLLIL